MIFRKFKNFTEAQNCKESILTSTYIEMGGEKIFIERKTGGFETTIQGKQPIFHSYDNKILTVGTALAAAIN